MVSMVGSKNYCSLFFFVYNYSKLRGKLGQTSVNEGRRWWLGVWGVGIGESCLKKYFLSALIVKKKIQFWNTKKMQNVNTAICIPLNQRKEVG